MVLSFLLNSLSSKISLFAAEITEEGSSSVSGPVGSGNLTCCSPLRFPIGLKYVKIDFDIHMYVVKKSQRLHMQYKQASETI